MRRGDLEELKIIGIVTRVWHLKAVQIGERLCGARFRLDIR